MLINLSNHPSSKWSGDQKNTALALYGNIEDMTFPHIDPHATRDQVTKLAEKYYTEIRSLDPSAVHLMGELTFSFVLANLLKESEIPCVASTTERIVVEEGNQKISTFKFVQFRSYF